MRQIPATMATQHPDNALAPKWKADGKAFIGTYDELEEAMQAFTQLGITEYMWDWEGKYADSAVVDKLLTTYHDYFSKHQLGRDRFLTFRIPNIWQEKGYSLMQAMTAVLTGEDYARDLKMSQRPLFEVILPMTESADQVMKMQKKFEQLANFKSEVFKNGPDNTSYLELIPLVESVESQEKIGELLEEYYKLHLKHFGKAPQYIRPFLARSDPALISGQIPTVLGNRVALSRMYEFSAKYRVPVHPIAGPGSLPFRGGLSPETAANYAARNPGLRTVTIQSAFRYDYPDTAVKKAVKILNETLPATKPHLFDDTRHKQLASIISIATETYRSALKDIIKDVEPIFNAIPKRRERRQHIGLLAYKRSVDAFHLPRAITFTAGFYSLGVPPELIGSGRALAKLSSQQLDVLIAEYPSLKEDMDRAGRYLNKNNLKLLAKRNKAWRQVEEDIEAIEKVLGLKLGPKTANESSHVNMSANIFIVKKNPRQLTALINDLAILRKSLG